MVQLLIYQLMKTRGITAYALSKGTDLGYPSAYRLSRPGGVFGRLHAETLNRLCEFFRVQPGKLIRWVPAAAGVPGSQRRGLAAPPGVPKG
jgi:DNA-binding Xre family transcriptional regulator